MNNRMEIPETHRSGAHPRSYHTFTLPANGLRCCVISDQGADKAAASIAVAAGQLHDKAEGIAHLTEHMLFMGSTTYPAENEYDQYLQQNGGHSNAYTDLEATCFYLDVAAAAAVDSDDNDNSNNKFRGALDRLACAVSEPLIRAASLERELQAVDSEHAKNVAQDHWRIHQLSRGLLGGGVVLVKTMIRRQSITTIRWPILERETWNPCCSRPPPEPQTQRTEQQQRQRPRNSSTNGCAPTFCSFIGSTTWGPT